MVTRHKSLTLALIAMLVVLSLIIVKPSFASITKPTVPEFTVKFVDRSYDVPAASSVDHYTGQTITTPAHHVQNYTIDLIIKNQPFTSMNIDGENASFYYNVRMKGHFSENWITLYNPVVNPYLAQENSDKTVITFQLVYRGSESGYSIGPDAQSTILSGLHSDAQIDFQVQALIGFVHRGYNASATNQLEMFPWVFDGETSNWTNTQTLTISLNNGEATNQSQTSPNGTSIGTQTSTIQQSFGWTEVSLFVAVCVIGLLLAIVFIRKKGNK
jgi:hypothetical protein